MIGRYECDVTMTSSPEVSDDCNSFCSYMRKQDDEELPLQFSLFFYLKPIYIKSALVHLNAVT